MFGRGEKERREIASLTKMMTAYTILALVDRFKIDMESELVHISEDVQHV